MMHKNIFSSVLVIALIAIGCSHNVEPTKPQLNTRPIIIYINSDQTPKPTISKEVFSYIDETVMQNLKFKYKKSDSPEIKSDQNHTCKWVSVGKFSVYKCEPTLNSKCHGICKTIPIKCTGYYLKNSQELAIIKKGFRKCPREIVENIKCKNLNSISAQFGCVYTG